MTIKHLKHSKTPMTVFISVSLLLTAGFFIYTLTLGADSFINLFVLRCVACASFLVISFLSLLLFRHAQKCSSDIDRFYDLAYYNTLTGMPNANYMYDEAAHLLSVPNKNYAFVVSKIKKSEVINSVFGEDKGNLLLKHMASCLINEVKPDEIATYFHSNLFCMLLSYNTTVELEERLRTMDKKISVFSLDSNTTYNISTSFGVYTIENPPTSLDEVFFKAMMALKSLDDRGDTATLYFYNDEMRKNKISEAEICENIEAAIANNELKLYLLPKYSMRTGKIAGAEALVRWHHPTKGIIVPDNFISVLEKKGFIEKMDLHMLEEACKMLRSQLDDGIEPAPISLNQSRVNLYIHNYYDKLIAITKKYDIPSRYIEFELSEINFIDDEASMKRIVDRFHALGFKVSVDDFCESVSSLNIFNNIKIDEIKIDEKFFMRSTKTEIGQTLVSSIIAMANSLGIAVVAEGVEARYQIDMLKQTDCQYVQGHYISEDVHVEAYTKMLKNNKVIIF